MSIYNELEQVIDTNGMHHLTECLDIDADNFNRLTILNTSISIKFFSHDELSNELVYNVDNNELTINVVDPVSQADVIMDLQSFIQSYGIGVNEIKNSLLDIYNEIESM